MKKNIIAGFLLLTICIGALPLRTYALSPMYDFGGRLSTVFYCSCMNAFLLTIVGPKPGMFIYYPGVSVLYLNFLALVPGVNQLGRASLTPVPCMTYVGTGCVPSGLGMPIIMMGTSLSPG